MNGDDRSASNLGREWLAIGRLLGLPVVAPATVTLPCGQVVAVDALLPNFGARYGMVLVTNFERVSPHAESIVEAGYGFSTPSDLGPIPRISSADVESIQEILRDWGWSGTPEATPVWMNDTECRDATLEP